MNKELQRLEIAKVCGWTNAFPRDEGRLLLPYKWHNNITRENRLDLPDYLNDLNAMHEAEKILTPEQSKRYAEFILDILEIPTPFIGTARCAFLTGHATAEQRAEAFLKTLGLWK